MSEHDSRSGNDIGAAQREFDRRKFLESMGVVAAGGVLGKLGLFDDLVSPAFGARRARKRPNILILLVDELRFPSVFPAGIKTPAQFLRKYMPNLYELWRHGVKFTNYHTAGNACSPARAAIVTGLYPHQQWLLSTRTPVSPALQTAFPTYGRLLRGLGYHTPYVGKWHLSNAPRNGSTAGYLRDYGFAGMTNPDPWGENGEGWAKDSVIADQAVNWLQRRSRREQPYCLTVSLVNPHDRQYFWSGTEATSFRQLFAGQSLLPHFNGDTSIPGEDAPPPLGYPALPPNWESGATLARTKPRTQTAYRAFQQFVWGGISDDASASGFTIAPYPTQPDTLGIGVAPFSYWSRGLDLYTYVMTMVDAQLGRVVASIPKDQLRDTVIVVASDHGEYNGAHGFLAGKLGTAYDEAWHVPLIVVDPSGRFTDHIDTPRRQLVSSVDFMPMLVSLGNGGSRSWMKGSLRKLYGRRLDLVRLLRYPRAAGRSHLIFATDEVLPISLDVGAAPRHVLGVQTPEAKLCTYSRWRLGTTVPNPRGLELEYYDYATEAGRKEMHSTPEDPRAKRLANKLFAEYVPAEMEAPLPTAALRRASRRARRRYLAFLAAADVYSINELIRQRKLRDILGYGLNI